MNNEPVAWGYKDFNGDIRDCICPEEHDRAEGDYTIPLYTHPVKELTDEEIHQAIRRGFSRDGFLSDGIFLEIKELLRKAQEK